MRVRGEGEVGPGGPGDLYVLIRVTPHSLFRRAKNDLELDHLVSFTRATLGGEIEVPTLSGSVTMKLPAGTECNKVFRVRGKGMPDVHHSGEYGDLYVRVIIDIPRKLNGEQKRLLETFAKMNGEK
jgi:molecular chaperone DnaJ